MTLLTWLFILAVGGGAVWWIVSGHHCPHEEVIMQPRTGTGQTEWRCLHCLHVVGTTNLRLPPAVEKTLAEQRAARGAARRATNTEIGERKARRDALRRDRYGTTRVLDMDEARKRRQRKREA